MNKKLEYWKWKNTIIDFDAISDEKDEYSDYITKKDIVFRYLGTPDNKIHEWYNGGFSSEYNTALRYARQLGLVEDYIDYDEIIYNLQQQIDRAIEELDDPFEDEDGDASWYEIAETYKEQIKIALDILNERRMDNNV